MPIVVAELANSFGQIFIFGKLGYITKLLQKFSPIPKNMKKKE